MMGSKERHFAPLISVSLEELVPQDHFYRHLERTLDRSFVREFVHETYAGIGRPSIDPVVFFKLQLVMFFEGIRSERQLMRHAADRLSIRWFLSYDLGEPLPDHSSLTRIRERYGVDVFRRFFDAIVEQCQKEKLVWGKELYIDNTQVNAKDWHGLRRFRLRRLWRFNCEALRIATGQNLKRLLKKRGWRRRPFPVEALCASFWGLLCDVLVFAFEGCSPLMPIGSVYSMVRTYCVSLC